MRKVIYIHCVCVCTHYLHRCMHMCIQERKEVLWRKLNLYENISTRKKAHHYLPLQDVFFSFYKNGLQIFMWKIVYTFEVIL